MVTSWVCERVKLCDEIGHVFYALLCICLVRLLSFQKFMQLGVNFFDTILTFEK